MGFKLAPDGPLRAFWRPLAWLERRQLARKKRARPGVLTFAPCGERDAHRRGAKARQRPRH